MVINFVGIELVNPHWSEFKNIIRDTGLFEHINTQKLKEYTGFSQFDETPHVTLAYSDELKKGPNWMNYFLTIKNRDLYNELRKIPVIDCPNIQLNTFDNEDARVLKFDLSECKEIDILRRYSKVIYELTENGSKFPSYNPHVTLTYLNPDTPTEVIDNFRDKVLLNNFTKFDIKGWLMSEKDNPNSIKIDIKSMEDRG